MTRKFLFALIYSHSCCSSISSLRKSEWWNATNPIELPANLSSHKKRIEPHQTRIAKNTSRNSVGHRVQWNDFDRCRLAHLSYSIHVRIRLWNPPETKYKINETADDRESMNSLTLWRRTTCTAATTTKAGCDFAHSSSFRLFALPVSRASRAINRNWRKN